MNLQHLLTPPKIIAIIGLSGNPDRASYAVAQYLIAEGFTVIPVNPSIQEVLGLKSYPSLSDIPEEISIDIVDIFRAPQHVLPIVEEIIQLQIQPLIWMQEMVVSDEAAQLAESHGLQVVMNLCIMKEHRKLHAK
jgi:predicted CoA-binding protein